MAVTAAAVSEPVPREISRPPALIAPMTFAARSAMCCLGSRSSVPLALSGCGWSCSSFKWFSRAAFHGVRSASWPASYTHAQLKPKHTQ